MKKYSLLITFSNAVIILISLYYYITRHLVVLFIRGVLLVVVVVVDVVVVVVVVVGFFNRVAPKRATPGWVLDTFALVEKEVERRQHDGWCLWFVFLSY